jgi:hypothetical protein
MDNNRISDAARGKVQEDHRKEQEEQQQQGEGPSRDDLRRIHARKAAKFNSKLIGGVSANDFNLFS